ncbi:hypothetical protein LCER1_G003502 [Lachnellula cervina]|uniref:C2H2-type domain-containing protein n=1 Tax=Lachnellula cervina TaxID=1316786 RepID=A0A7D8UT26_9HELO|nr:hypothetical protein LCER1_G003502 [Lachnellula cervina]
MDPNSSYSFDESALQQQAFTDLFGLDGNFGSESLPDGPLDPMFGLSGFQASQGAMQQPASNALAFNGGLSNDPLDPMFRPSGFQASQGAMQQPASDPSALNGNGVDFNSNPFNQPLGSMNGAFSGLTNCPTNNYQQFNQTAIQQPSTTNFWSPDNNALAFGAPYSFDQATLPQGSVTDMSALNATANNDAFGGSYSMDQNALNMAAFSTGSDLDALFELDESDFWKPSSGIGSRMPIPPLFSCDWPGCNSKEVFTCNLSHSQHVSAVHIQDVLNNSSNSCTWPGCLKSKLDTHQKLKTHVTNIHIDPFRCIVTGCKRTEPFGRKGDLERHMASVHQHGRTWKCAEKGCKRHTNGFPRKDKLTEHKRATGHGGGIRCSYNHCYWKDIPTGYFLTEAELSSHINDLHGNYECAVGTCVGTVSAFSLDDLKNHLRSSHLLNDSNLRV